MIQVTYIDKRGAGRMRAFRNGDEAARFLSTLRCDAVATDAKGAVVGRCWELDKSELRGMCRRAGHRRWGWWLDPDAA